MTNNNESTDVDNNPEEIEDLSGLAEMQDSFAEIERLKNANANAAENNPIVSLTRLLVCFHERAFW